MIPSTRLRLTATNRMQIPSVLGVTIRVRAVTVHALALAMFAVGCSLPPGTPSPTTSTSSPTGADDGDVLWNVGGTGIKPGHLQRRASWRGDGHDQQPGRASEHGGGPGARDARGRDLQLLSLESVSRCRVGRSDHDNGIPGSVLRRDLRRGRPDDRCDLYHLNRPFLGHIADYQGIVTSAVGESWCIFRRMSGQNSLSSLDTASHITWVPHRVSVCAVERSAEG